VSWVSLLIFFSLKDLNSAGDKGDGASALLKQTAAVAASIAGRAAAAARGIERRANILDLVVQM
jgi:hypothetical protein